MKLTLSNKSLIVLVPLVLMVVSLASTASAGMGGKSNNDMVITQRVQEKLQGDNKLMGSNINVETKNGEVTLKGIVASEHDITRAAKLAHYVEGVRHVDNRLTTEKEHHYGAQAPIPGCQIGANWEC